MQPNYDPGLTQKFQGRITRVVEKDGTFHVRRVGRLRDRDLYLKLINARWSVFFGFLLVAFSLVNGVFALLYFVSPAAGLEGSAAASERLRFLNDVFFSVHTLTTVGYGNMYPRGIYTNTVAALEAMFGLLGFAIATGMLYGRFSRPRALIHFSENLLVAPYQSYQSLQFRIANRRANELMELEASVILMTVEGEKEAQRRAYAVLELERPKVLFFPLTWTVVHPIDGQSPLFGKSREQIEALQAELLIMIKGFDDTYSQTVHARYSYTTDEWVWGARFQPAFDVDPTGDLRLNLHRVSLYRRIEESGETAAIVHSDGKLAGPRR